MDSVFAESKFSCQTVYPVLESVINETMRLYPPVLFGSQRVTPPEGLRIGNVYIPGDIVVYMPTWQLHHDPRNFEKPDEFVPERWTSKSEMIFNRGAFLPFLIGKSNPSKQVHTREQY
jgi:cytochrome P450